MFFSFVRNQQRSPLLRLPAEIRNMIYRYVLDTAIIRIPLASTDGRIDQIYNSYGLLPRFLFQTPSILFVARQIHGEASAFLDQYIAVRITLEPRRLLSGGRAVPNNRLLWLVNFFAAIRFRASRFRAVQELEIPQRVLDLNVRFKFRRLTHQILPALETVVWTPGRNLSQQVREETVRYTFDRSGLRIVDSEADVANDGAGDDDEWIDDEGESDEEDPKGKDDSGDYEDTSMDKDSS
jgi:hypothetical protein